MGVAKSLGRLRLSVARGVRAADVRPDSATIIFAGGRFFGADRLCRSTAWKIPRGRQERGDEFWGGCLLRRRRLQLEVGLLKFDRRCCFLSMIPDRRPDVRGPSASAWAHLILRLKRGSFS